MTKVTQELPFKFFLSYEDAEDNLIYATAIVEIEIEPPHTLHKTTILDSMKLSSMGRNVMLVQESGTIATGIFKLRLMDRENIFGAHKEQVYILQSTL
jgi:hypothetical protein